MFLLTLISPSSLSFSSGLESDLCSVSFFLILFLLFVSSFWFHSSLFFVFLCDYWAYSLPLYISPCLSLGPCVALMYPSVYPFVHLSVCPSVRQGPRGMWEGCGDPSLPAWLVVLSQSLRRSAHLCEARRVRARAHANSAFLCLFDLGQNVSDLSLGQLGDRAELRRWAA